MKTIIAIDGPDYSGKTHAVCSLYDFLSKTMLVERHREPGGTLVGEAVRDIVKSNSLSNTSNLFAMLLSRSVLLEHVAGSPTNLHIFDRSDMSTYAYQCEYKEDSEADRVFAATRTILNRPFEEPVTRIYIVLDVSGKVSAQRKLECSDRDTADLENDAIEKAYSDSDRLSGCYRKAVSKYKEWNLAEPENLTLIDTSELTIEQTVGKVIEFVKDRLEEIYAGNIRFNESKSI